MDDVTLKALKDSIAKWEKNTRAEEPDEVSIGRDYCPLCGLFNTPLMSINRPNQRCDGCPVSKKTGEKFCNNTPYDEAEFLCGAWESGQVDSSTFHKAAHDEVDFLKSLLPEDAS